MDEKKNDPASKKEISKVVEDAVASKNQNDQRMKNLQGRGPYPAPNGPHGGFQRNGSYQVMKLQEYSKDINAKTYDRVHMMSEGMSGKDRQQVKDKAMTKLYPEQDRTTHNTAGKHNKDLDNSQERWMQMKADVSRQRVAGNEEKSLNDMDRWQNSADKQINDFRNRSAPRPEKQQEKASDRFISGLKGQKNEIGDKGGKQEMDKTAAPGKDGSGGKPQSGKGFSMSGKFSQSLSYNHRASPETPRGPSKSTPSKSDPSTPGKE